MTAFGFVLVFNRSVPGALAEVPEELLDHWAATGWERFPVDEVNILDRDAVADFLADPPPPPEPKPKSRKPKES
jgi:hypothetical protein